MQLSFFLSIFALSGAGFISASTIRERCTCTREYDPVCARLADGSLREYATACVANCHGVSSFVQGRCSEQDSGDNDSPCVCPEIYLPVCGRKNGVWRDFGNDCVADCGGVTERKRGRCSDVKEDAKNCPCPYIYSPKCARLNGVWQDFPNGCSAECVGATEMRDGKCGAIDEETCIRACPLIYLPVCANGKTYPSSCSASCHKELKFKEGECEQDVSKMLDEIIEYRERRRSEPCGCLRIYDPVCANDGMTYSNEDCAVRCGGAKKVRKGNCDVVCPLCANDKSYKPVCDVSKIFYRNRCFATQCFETQGILSESFSRNCD